MNNQLQSIALRSTLPVVVIVLLFLEHTSESISTSERFLSEPAENDATLAPLFPLRTIDYVGFVSSIIGLVLCAGGGIGGGGLLIPIFILVMRYPVKHAVSFSNITVFGGAVANTMLNASKRHPTVNRPLIDWNLLAIMEPSAMAGALVGANLVELLPDIMVIIMLVLLLSFITARTFTKANKMYARESADRALSKETMALVSDDKSRSKSISYGTQDNITMSNEKCNTHNLAMLLEEESRVPWTRIVQISTLFLMVVLLNLVEGSGYVACGSTGFVSLEISNLVIIVIFVLCIQRQMAKETERKQALSYEFAEGDVIWDTSSTWKYSMICSIAGLCAGLFGIGGGMIFAPLMLEMGVHPAVSSATSATMILFTSFIATTSFMVFGQLDYEYAIVFSLVGFLSTMIGQLLMDALLSKYNRNSYIAYCISLVVGISAFAMTVESVVSLSQGQSQHGAGMCA